MLCLGKGGLQLGGRRVRVGPESKTALSSRWGDSPTSDAETGEDQERREEVVPSAESGRASQHVCSDQANSGPEPEVLVDP